MPTLYFLLVESGNIHDIANKLCECFQIWIIETIECDFGVDLGYYSIQSARLRSAREEEQTSCDYTLIDPDSRADEISLD